MASMVELKLLTENSEKEFANALFEAICNNHLERRQIYTALGTADLIAALVHDKAHGIIDEL